MGCGISKYSNFISDTTMIDYHNTRELLEILKKKLSFKLINNNIIINDTHLARLVNFKKDNKNILSPIFLLFRLYNIDQITYQTLVDKHIREIDNDSINPETLYFIEVEDIETKQIYSGFVQYDLYTIYRKSNKFKINFFFLIANHTFKSYLRPFKIILESNNKNIENIQYLITKLNERKLYTSLG